MATVHYKDILFYWGFENSLTVEKSFGDTTATAQSAATFAAPPTKAGVASSMPGSYSGSYPTPFDCHTFVVSNGDIVDHISGRVGFYVYIDTWADGDFLWNCSYNSSNQIYLALTTISTVKQIQLHYRSGGGDSANVFGGTLAEDAWYFIEAKWNLSGTNPNLELFINGSSVGTATDAQGAWAATPTLCEVGTPTDLGSVIYVDQLIHSNDPARDLYAIRDRTDFLSVTTVVDPDSGSGYDYDSLSDWEADLGGTTSGNLPADNEIAVAKCRCTGGTADTTAVTINGWTTDSTRYIKIWTDPSESYRHNGTWQTGNKYRIVSSASWGQGTLRIAEQYVRIIGLQIDNTAEDQANGIVADSSAQSTSSYLLISHNILRLSGGGGSSSHYGINSIERLNSYVINNIVYGWEYGIYITYSEVAVNICIYNNTIVNCSSSCVVNYSYSGANVRLYNNIAQGTSSEGNYVNDPNASGSNISSDTTSPNAAYRSKTVTFVGSGNYHLSSSDTEARNNGTNLYNDSYYAFQTDIDGDDRGGSGASWDIGADEYIDSYQLPVNRQYIRGATATWYEVVDVYVLKDGVFVPDKIIKILDSGSWI